MRGGILTALLLAGAVPLAFGSGASEAAAPEGAASAAPTGAREGAGVTTYVTVAAYETATGTLMPAYSEAPMLTERVQAKQLPVLEQRLPDQPAVVVPYEEPGTYGGTLRADATFFRSLLKRGLFMRDVNGVEIIPDLALGYEASDDFTSYKIHLRPETNWSDGVPFTTQDIMFWWNDEMNNAELSPAGPSWIWANADVTAVDDYTVQIDFSVSSPTFMGAMSHPFTASRGHFYLPKHYQQKWHIAYHDDADKVAAEEGYEGWVQAYRYHAAKWFFQDREKMPVLTPWIVTTVASTHYDAERNPYFWQVDSSGKQLPYIDKVVAVKSADPQTKLMQAIGGEVHYLSGFSTLSISDFPLLKENEQQGDYRVLTLKGDYQSAFTVGFNPVVKDAVLLDIFHDIRFREALSLAIDRDALNESVFFGLATPRQVAPLPNVSFYDNAWSDYLIQYDPERANELLDQVGLRWDAEHKLRLRPDGKPMNLLMESGHGSVPEATVAEVIKNMWEKVGITLTIKPEKIIHERLQQGELYETLIVDGGGNSTELDLQGFEFVFWEVGGGGHSWNRWINSGGADGTEPPAEWQELAQWVAESMTLIPGTEEWISLKQKIWDWRIKQLWHIGTVYAAPVFDVVSNKLRNVPSGFWFGWSIGFHPLLMSQQWFLTD